MGNRAIYQLIENSNLNYFTAHYGANALSPLLRLSEAMEIQELLPNAKTISYIFEHLDYEGKYKQDRTMDADMFFQCIEPQEVKKIQNSYANHSELEMRITINLDKNYCLLEYNPNCPWYRTMGNYSIDLDVGLENVKKLLIHAENHGITDFGRLLTIYHSSTGLSEKLESARGNMELEKFLDSPYTEEVRKRYSELTDRYTWSDETEEMREMEER